MRWAAVRSIFLAAYWTKSTVTSQMPYFEPDGSGEQPRTSPAYADALPAASPMYIRLPTKSGGGAIADKPTPDDQRHAFSLQYTPRIPPALWDMPGYRMNRGRGGGRPLLVCPKRRLAVCGWLRAPPVGRILALGIPDDCANVVVELEQAG